MRINICSKLKYKIIFFSCLGLSIFSGLGFLYFEIHLPNYLSFLSNVNVFDNTELINVKSVISNVPLLFRPGFKRLGEVCKGEVLNRAIVNANNLYNTLETLTIILGILCCLCLCISVVSVLYSRSIDDYE